jgi:hypothetical protein
MAGIGFGGQGSTYQVVNGQGLGPRTIIVTLKQTADANAVVPAATIQAFLAAVGNAGGSGNGTDRNGPDAFTVTAVSGVNLAATGANRGDSAAGGITVALQGTGTLDVTVALHTVATVATFDQTPA